MIKDQGFGRVKEAVNTRSFSFVLSRVSEYDGVEVAGKMYTIEGLLTYLFVTC